MCHFVLWFHTHAVVNLSNEWKRTLSTTCVLYYHSKVHIYLSLVHFLTAECNAYITHPHKHLPLSSSSSNACWACWFACHKVLSFGVWSTELEIPAIDRSLSALLLHQTKAKGSRRLIYTLLKLAAVAVDVLCGKRPYWVERTKTGNIMSAHNIMGRVYVLCIDFHGKYGLCCVTK